MAITPFSDDLNIIAGLSDNPVTDDGLTADQFKAKFDAAALKIKSYINNTLIGAVAEKTHAHPVAAQVAEGNTNPVASGAVYTALTEALTGKENTLDANQKRHIFISATEPATWSDGDIWLKTSG